MMMMMIVVGKFISRYYVLEPAAQFHGNRTT